MRVTSSMIHDQLARALQRSMAELAEAQERLASGKKINKPSDDVIGMVRALDYRLSISTGDQYRRNIEEAEAQLGFADAALTSLNRLIQDAKGLAVAGASGTLDADVLAALARDAAHIREALLSLGNSRFRDRYIFAGFRTDQPAFDAATLAYQGDGGLIRAAIDRAGAMPVNIPGSGAFAYALPAAQSVQLGTGRFVHYTPGGGTTVNVEIRDTDNVTVLDSFSFSNVIEATDVLAAALAAGDSERAAALVEALDRFNARAISAQAEAGVRLAHLDDQKNRLSSAALAMQEALSAAEDADLALTAMELNKAETALQALLKSSGRIFSQSLLDFLR